MDQGNIKLSESLRTETTSVIAWPRPEWEGELTAVMSRKKLEGGKDV